MQLLHRQLGPECDYFSQQRVGLHDWRGRHPERHEYDRFRDGAIRHGRDKVIARTGRVDAVPAQGFHCGHFTVALDLKLNSDLHDLGAWNIEVGARLLCIVMHERKNGFAPRRHCGPPARGNNGLVTGKISYLR
jgi:hypothetical protein